MGATFSRIKNWTTEVLSNTDLNAEIDNILDNLGPAGVDDYSTTTTQMKLTVDPGEVGTESLATSLAGELERLRFAIKEIKGTDAAQWYSSPGISLTDVLGSLGGSVGDNRIVSGAASSNSGAPRFLVASGTTLSVTLDAAPTSFAYYINGVSYTATADTTFSSLTAAPTTNNTCLVDDAQLTGQERSKWTGEDGTELVVDNMGSSISAFVDKYAGFKVVSGGNTEYFIGYVKSSTRITNCLRGYFFNSSNAAIPRIPISDNNTITLTRLTWMFANTSAGLAASNVNPIISYATPSDTGVYWLDMANDIWKTHNGSNWVTASATLIGACVQDETACKGARGFDFFKSYDPYSNVQLDHVTVGQVQARNFGSKLGVGSTLINYGGTRPVWDMAVSLESGYAESASTTYFLYVGDSGQIKISPERPYYSAGAGKAWYHPYEIWRAVGSIQNDSGSNFDRHTLKTYPLDPTSEINFTETWDLRNLGIRNSVANNSISIVVCAADGADLGPGNPCYVNFRSSSATAGTTVLRKLIQNLTISVNSAASLGHKGSINQYIWTYLLDNVGTIDVGVIGVVPQPDVSIQNTTQIGGSSTAGSVLYSAGTALTNVACRLVGRLTTNVPTAGNWTSPATTVAVQPPLLIAMEDWGTARTFTPSAGFGSVSLAFTASRRLGDSLEVQGFWRNGVVAASAAQITMPIDWDAADIPGGGKRITIGYFYSSDAGGGLIYTTASRTGPIFLDVSQTAQVCFGNAGSGGEHEIANGNSISGNSEGVHFRFMYPVKGWSTYGP